MNAFLTDEHVESILSQTMSGALARGGWLAQFAAKRLVTVTAESIIEMPGPTLASLEALKADRHGEGPDIRDTDDGRRLAGYMWLEQTRTMPVILVAWVEQGQSPVHVQAWTKGREGDASSAAAAIDELAQRLRPLGDDGPTEPDPL